MSSDTNPSEARFVEGDNGTIVDRTRRLLWLKKDTWQMTETWMNWVQVRDYALELNKQKFAGHNDWRVPTVAEAKSLYDKDQKNTDHMGQTISHHSIFEPGFGFVCWTSDVKNKIQAIRFGYRKGNQMYDDVYRTSRGATRMVRDIGKEEDLL